MASASASSVRSILGDSPAYAIAALLTSLAVVPVALSEDARPPALDQTERINQRELAKVCRRESARDSWSR